MSSTSVLLELREAHEKRRAEYITDYEAAKREVIEGRTVDDLASIIERAGRTPEEFTADVNAALGRKENHATINRAHECEKEIPALEAAILAAKEKLAAANIAFQQEVAPIDLRLAEIEDLCRAGQQAKNNLLRTAPPEKHSRLDSARQMVDLTRGQVQSAEAKVRSWRTAVSEADHEGARRECQRGLDDALGILAAVNGQAANANREFSQASEAMFEL